MRWCGAIVRSVTAVGLSLASLTAAGADGVRPEGADGRKLNLGFEDGTFKDWTVSGDAFGTAPVQGDAVFTRRGDMRSGHKGKYWAGSFEAKKDDGRGTLTSVPFKVAHRWASLMVAGGPAKGTRVELATAKDGKAFFQVSGTEHEQLRPVVVDLEKVVGQDIVIRVVDDSRGHWGHVNFDEFLFYPERPKLDNELKPNEAAPATDVVKYAGLSPEEAAKAVTLPEGFKATMFASEPDVVQPVAFTIDARGRLWVVELLTYPQRAPEGQGKDRILIFEDVDGDGKADKKTVFAENLNLATAIEVGFGGVFVGAAPYLLFIPDKNGDDKPDGEPQVLLDGWGYHDTHEMLNTFAWGPDGWLYGCHGVFTHSKVGKPGTPDDQRVKINAGIWRYHPVKQTFEVFAEGTSNPWGIDFDANGQLWAEACVIPHLWHIIPGARYQRQAGQHFNPYTYDDIKQHGDHVHYAGSGGPHAGNNRSDAAGGGHAHAGLMVYNGSAWPEQYKGKIFIGNIHGQRINMDVPEAKGSGFVGRHGPDFLNFNDRWSQIINFRTGPDGNVYFIDWYDAQQCHVMDPKRHDRGNGRIFKVSYGDKKAQPVDLAKLPDRELYGLALSGDAWNSYTARRLLQERAASGKIDASVRKGFPDPKDDDEQRMLRILWALNAAGLLNPDDLITELQNGVPKPPYAVNWMVRLLTEAGAPSAAAVQEFVKLARESDSQVVRLSLASALLRTPLEQRWDVLAGLLSHSKDAGDHNLPLMYWYAGEPLGAADPARAMKLAAGGKIPQFLSFMTRRIAALNDEKSLALLTESLNGTDDDAKRLEMLRGLAAAFAGRRDIPTPAGWDAVAGKLAASGSEEVRSLAQNLSVTFGSRAATDKMRKALVDANTPAAERTAALDSLVRAKDASVVPVLQTLLGDKAMRGAALRGLAAFDDPKTPEAILKHYGQLSVAEKRDALNTLASRPEYAVALFGAVETKVIPNGDITADLVRQLRNLANPDIDVRIGKTFQVQRQSPEEKLKQIADVKAMLTAAAAPPANASHGREVYARTCQQCHVLFGAGGNVGPDITGANRADLDYLLQTILDPNALIPVEYATTVVQTRDGRVLSGIVRAQDENVVTLVTANETVTLPRKDVRRMKGQDLSMMPEGLFDPLTEQEKRDLIAYLQSPKQVPLPATPENAKTLFNGKDLTGWWGNESVFRVENGEIVGKSETGLKVNEFLKSNLLVRDFRLTVQMKLVPDKANSGIQFRSVPLEDSTEMKGYQADAGAGWWGKLYHESGRALLWDKGLPPEALNKGDWNTYEILAVGHKIQTAINGKLCVDLDDPKGELDGVIALQVHSGGPTEVRFKDFELEVDPEGGLKTVK